MINNIKTWIHNNKVLSVILLILVIVLAKKFLTGPIIINKSMYSSSYSGMAVAPTKQLARDISESYDTASNAGNQEQKTITESNFSLLVKNVTVATESIKNQVSSINGSVIDVSIVRYESEDTANIQVRIPTNKVDAFTKYLRENSVKVVSEHVSGTDVTDTYYDAQTRLSQLEDMKAKLSDILKKAENVSEMMNVQQQIFYVQDQIDSIKGRIAYLDKTTSTTKFYITMSTDELSLPYTPDNAWRPNVVLKQAVRSMLQTLQDVGSGLIWVAVYAPFISVAIVLVIATKKALAKKKSK